MRRVWLLLLCGLLLLSGGCAYEPQTSSGETVYQLYYAVRDLKSTADGDAIATKPSLIKRENELDTQVQAEALIKELLMNPNEEDLKNPIPKGTKLISLTIADSHAAVDMSSSYGTLSGVALTLADYCITMTLTQVPGITSVSITSRGMELAYRGKQNLAATDLLLSSTENMLGTTRATLYFLNAKGQLKPEMRILKLYEGDTQADVLIQAMEKGPEEKDLKSPMPKGLIIQSVWMEDKTCYLSLTMLNSSNLAEKENLEVALDALTWSLRSLDTVRDVQIILNGELYQRLG